MVAFHGRTSHVGCELIGASTRNVLRSTSPCSSGWSKDEDHNKEGSRSMRGGFISDVERWAWLKGFTRKDPHAYGPYQQRVLITCRGCGARGETKDQCDTKGELPSVESTYTV